MHRGGVMFGNRLLRSALPPPQADFQLLPQPRGALSDLKPAPLPAGSLKHGTIKVSLGVQPDLPGCCCKTGPLDDPSFFSMHCVQVALA